MPKVIYNVEIEVDVTEAGEELLKVAGREVVSGINTSLDHNQNVDDIKVTAVEASVSLNINCLPDEEIAELAAT